MTPRARWTAVVTGLVAASAFSLSVWLAPWWTFGEANVGPRGSHQCFAGECRASDLHWMAGEPRWERSAIATWAAGLVAMFVLVMLSAGLASAREPRLIAKMAIAALVTAAAAGAYFALARPELAGGSIGYGLPAFALAVLVGAIPAVLTLRTR